MPGGSVEVVMGKRWLFAKLPSDDSIYIMHCQVFVLTYSNQ